MQEAFLAVGVELQKLTISLARNDGRRTRTDVGINQVRARGLVGLDMSEGHFKLYQSRNICDLQIQRSRLELLEVLDPSMTLFEPINSFSSFHVLEKLDPSVQSLRW